MAVHGRRGQNGRRLCPCTPSARVASGGDDLQPVTGTLAQEWGKQREAQDVHAGIGVCLCVYR